MVSPAFSTVSEEIDNSSLLLFLIPDGDGTFKVCFRSYEKGLIIITLGKNLLRVQPPLNISKENLHKAFTILDESLTELEKGDIPDSVFEYRHGW